MGSQKNHLIEKVLLSTQNLCFMKDNADLNHNIYGALFRLKISSFILVFQKNTVKCGTVIFSFCSQIKWAGIHKMLVKIANREDPDQTASSEAV